MLKKFQLQRSILTRTSGIVEKKTKIQGKSLESGICYYKLKNMLAICRIMTFNYQDAYFIFKLLSEMEPNLMPEWKNLDLMDAENELVTRLFFNALTLFEIKDVENSKKLFIQAKKLYRKMGNEKFKETCDQYLVKLTEMETS
jgi:tetratricopeptide (TPR) repeat protein